MTFSWATIRVRNLEDSLAFYHNLAGTAHPRIALVLLDIKSSC